MHYTFGLPFNILNNVVDNIQSFAASHTISVGFCICAAVTVTVSATSIAVGVGVGVGIGCQQTNIVNTTSIN